MGSISNYGRCGKFMTEFEEDILKVYALPSAPWIKRQYLEVDSQERVALYITLLVNNAEVDAILCTPIFYDANADDETNLGCLDEAMDCEGGLESDVIRKRMFEAGLIREEK